MVKSGLKKKMKTFAAAAAVLSMCLITGCGGASGGNGESAGNSASSGDSAGELKKVTLLLDWTPNTNHTGLYVAQEQGYFEEEGLDVDIEMPYNGTATQLVGAGKGDFGISNTDDTVYAVTLDDPMPVKSIAAVIQHNTSGFVSLKEKGIESPADWGGKTYGGFGGAAEEMVVRTIAEQNGVDPDTISFVVLGESDILTSLQRDIDFMWVFESTELVNLDRLGAEYNYIPIREQAEEFDYYTPVIIVNTDFADKDPEAVSAFLSAASKGYDYAAEHPGEAADILLAAEPELDKDIVKEGQEYLSVRYAQGAPQWGWQEEEVWSRYADFLFDNGLIENKAETANVYTNEYLPKA